MSLLNTASRESFDSSSHSLIISKEKNIHEQPILQEKISPTFPTPHRPHELAKIKSYQSSSTSNTSLVSSIQLQNKNPVPPESPLSNTLNRQSSTLEKIINISEAEKSPPAIEIKNTTPTYFQRVGNKFEKMVRRLAEMPLSLLGSVIAQLSIPLFLGVSAAFLLATPFLIINDIIMGKTTFDLNSLNKSVYFFAQAILQLHISICLAIKTVVAPIESVVTLTTTTLGMGDIFKKFRRHATKMVADPMMVLSGSKGKNSIAPKYCTSSQTIQEIIKKTREELSIAKESTIMNENRKKKIAYKLTYQARSLPFAISNAFARSYVTEKNFKDTGVRRSILKAQNFFGSEETSPRYKLALVCLNNIEKILSSIEILEKEKKDLSELKKFLDSEVRNLKKLDSGRIKFLSENENITNLNELKKIKEKLITAILENNKLLCEYKQISPVALFLYKLLPEGPSFQES